MLLLFYFFSDIIDDVDTLEQFTSDIVVDATVRCLKIIQPDTDIPRTLPQNMAARFHVGSALAETCKVSELFFLLWNIVNITVRALLLTRQIIRTFFWRRLFFYLYNCHRMIIL